MNFIEARKNCLTILLVNCASWAIVINNSTLNPKLLTNKSETGAVIKIEKKSWKMYLLNFFIEELTKTGHEWQKVKFWESKSDEKFPVYIYVHVNFYIHKTLLLTN